MKHWPYFLMLAIPAFAQIERAQLTWTLDAAGALRPVHGVAGGATLGDPVVEGVLSMACSTRGCVIKTDAALYSTSAEGRTALAPEGPALFAFAETETYAYFSWPRQFARWREADLEYLNFAVEGDVLSLRAAGDGFDYAVAREDGTWMEHYSALDESVIALAWLGPTGVVMLLEGGGVLLAGAEEVRLMRPDFDDLVFAIPGAGQFTALPGGYVQVSAASGQWLLSADQAFLLPPPPARPEASQ